MNAFFVTGTDTEVGKTFTSCRMLELAAKSGMSTLGLKPVAAGGEWIDDRLENEDAQALIESSTIKLPYEQVNPVMLEDACSPHIAAARAGRQVSATRIAGFCRGALIKRPDFALVEGAGGWRVPISSRETMANIAIHLNLPVILVVGLRLGCLNHAMLTAEAIQRDGLKLVAWVGNQISSEPMPFFEENVQTLRSAIGAPCLGVLPFVNQAEPERIVDFSNVLDLSYLKV